MKKDKKTFAQRAKQITEKYRARLGKNFERYDKLAVGAMNKELEALQQEQEQVKQLKAQMEQPATQPQMALGGPLNFQSPAAGMQLPDMGTSNNFSYVNPINAEISMTNYQRQPDQPMTGLAAMDNGRMGNTYKKQTPQDIAALRTQLQGGVKTAQQAERQLGGRSGGEWGDYRFGLSDKAAANIRAGKPSNARKYGGALPQYSGLGPYNSFLPDKPLDINTMEGRYGMGNYAVPGFPAAVQNYKTPMQPGMDQRYGKPNGKGFPAEVGNAAYTQEAQQKIIGANATHNKKDAGGNWIKGLPNEALIGMGSQALGTIAQGLLTKKPKDINATPVNVPDYVPVQNEEAIRQAKLAYAGQQAGSRYLSPSQYMAQMNALAAGEAGTTAGIAEQTSNANAQGMNAYNMQKAGFEGDYRRQQLMADEYNSQNQIGYNAMLAGIPAALGQQVAGGMRDVMGYKQQQDTIKFMDQPGYGSKYIGDRLIQTIKPAPGFEHYEDPKTGETVFYHNGKKLSGSEEYQKLLMKWKNKE